MYTLCTVSQVNRSWLCVWAISFTSLFSLLQLGNPRMRFSFRHTSLSLCSFQILLFARLFLFCRLLENAPLLFFVACFFLCFVYSCRDCRPSFVYILFNKIYFLFVEMELIWYIVIAYGWIVFIFCCHLRLFLLNKWSTRAHRLQNRFVSNRFVNFLLC